MDPLDPPATVLYVDSYVGVDRAVTTFTPPDIDVTFETDPDRALGECESGRFECLVVGTTVAGGSGLAMLGALRETTDLPVVALSGPDGARPGTLFEAGATDCARPPRDEDAAATLAARIRNVVTRVRAERRAATDHARTAAMETGDAEFRSLAERLDEVVWIRDADGRLTYVNPAFETVWGLDREAVYEDESLFFEAIHPDDRPDGGVFSTGTHEYRVDRPDGDVRWVRDHVRRPDDGGPAAGRTVGVAEDVTAYRQLSAELESNVRALRKLYEVSADPDLDFEVKTDRLLEIGCDLLGTPYGFLTQIDGEIQTAVAVHGPTEVPRGHAVPLATTYCRRTIEADGLLGIRDAVDEGMEDDPAYERFGFNCYLGGKVLVDDHLYGTVCFAGLEPRETPFTEAERTVVELLTQWFSHELTRQSVEARLRRRNDRLDQFASVVSHDLRNPINVVEGSVVLAQQTADAPDVCDHLEKARDGLDRMESLISDLLELSRRGDTIDDLAPVSIERVATAAWETVGGTPDNLTLDVPGEWDEPLEADPARLRQLFENLFRNAVEHVGPDVTVEVGALDDHGFYVADDGPGLPEEGAAFDVGFSTSDDGTGLGLSIVKRIAEAHDWGVEAVNDDGARFEFRATTHVAA